MECCSPAANSEEYGSCGGRMSKGARMSMGPPLDRLFMASLLLCGDESRDLDMTRLMDGAPAAAEEEEEEGEGAT